MKQLLILSGKGGTGKTTVAGAFIKLAQPGGYADCDVDAPNLHLVLQGLPTPEHKDYYGLPKAYIDPSQCVNCGLCKKYCRFDAVLKRDKEYYIDPNSCEGCGVCTAVCPAKAVILQPAVSGDLFLYKGDTVFSTAKLRMGSGASGKLVAEVKKDLKSAVAPDTELAIIDGSPGIGCPVIASISGVDMVLIVTEPSISGISDLKRIVATAKTFKVAIVICINKYDTNLEHTTMIEEYCHAENLPMAGKIPFDNMVVQANNNGISITEIDCPAGKAVRDVFAEVIKLLK